MDVTRNIPQQVSVTDFPTSHSSGGHRTRCEHQRPGASCRPAERGTPVRPTVGTGVEERRRRCAAISRAAPPPRNPGRRSRRPSPRCTAATSPGSSRAGDVVTFIRSSHAEHSTFYVAVSVCTDAAADPSRPLLEFRGGLPHEPSASPADPRHGVSGRRTFRSASRARSNTANGGPATRLAARDSPACGCGRVGAMASAPRTVLAMWVS